LLQFSSDFGTWSLWNLVGTPLGAREPHHRYTNATQTCLCVRVCMRAFVVCVRVVYACMWSVGLRACVWWCGVVWFARTRVCVVCVRVCGVCVCDCVCVIVWCARVCVCVVCACVCVCVVC
jgi:hypothetical protein